MVVYQEGIEEGVKNAGKKSFRTTDHLAYL